MVKHIQKIRRQFADELSVFDHFVGLALKRLMIITNTAKIELCNGLATDRSMHARINI